VDLSHAATGFGLGIALGVSPGPVQVLLLTESARGGVGRGFRAMLGANGTFLVLLLLLAAGFSAITPTGTAIRVLEVLGGAFLLFVAVDAGRETIRGEDVRKAEEAAERARREARSSVRAAVVAHPATRGVVAVLLNPGSWLFLATTASALLANAVDDGGRPAAFVTAIALMAGVSVMDAVTVLLGGGSALLTGRAGRWIRLVLTGVLGAIGVVFVVRGIRG
jgi:threonine/homoserine/homoserine lactone efflux protein